LWATQNDFSRRVTGSDNGVSNLPLEHEVQTFPSGTTGTSFGVNMVKVLPQSLITVKTWLGSVSGSGAAHAWTGLLVSLGSTHLISGLQRVASLRLPWKGHRGCLGVLGGRPRTEMAKRTANGAHILLSRLQFVAIEWWRGDEKNYHVRICIKAGKNPIFSKRKSGFWFLVQKPDGFWFFLYP
jgi:hypothetical protein